MTRVTPRQVRLKSRFLRRPDDVLAVLGLSALVAAGSAYVAVDYVMRPFEQVVVAAPVADPIGPFLAETAGAEASPATLISEDATPQLAALPEMPAPGQFDAPAPSPVRVVYGVPVVSPPLRPESGDPQFAAAPIPRPENADDAGFRLASSIEASGPPAGASLFVEPGLSASLVPAPRPSDIARIVASARRPAEATLASSVEVARAEAPDVEVAPARLELASIGPIRGAGNPCTGRLARAIPNRSRSAPGGSEVIAAVNGSSGADRDRQILQAAFSGNVPDFLRNLRPVSFSGTTASGQEAVVTICVMPDYLAVGSDRDFVRVPLGLGAALQVADQFDMMLPTPRMVDAIYAQADLRLSPQPMTPGAQMTTTTYFLRHDGLVDQQMARAGGRLGLLVAGQKKDIVLANRLSSNPGRIAIYGWHRSSGSPIQPLSTVHGANYADYSHGVRLVSQTAFVNGQAVDLADLLTDARYASMLNSDGPITGRALQLASLR